MYERSGVEMDHPTSITVVDVTADLELFRTFCDDWRASSRYAISLACRRVEEPETSLPNSIGWHSQSGMFHVI